MRWPVVDLSVLSGKVALAVMLKDTDRNPLEHIDRVLAGELPPGVFRRYVGVRQVLVLTRIPW